ncbi:C40 family peptidase [Pedobacter africanus]|uniref:SH3 domain-containing protein n=1 Tax=Pedobacter africanus TaxID=151894 RepID=A0A1W1ZLM2_9SPHI|nr:C40 family peptidase [Pedobacter africanus]SMC49112.1 SH3 domain-containing protein [Pedobacter africanus]
MEQQYGICRIAVAPLRAEPSDKAEIASQLLFGDHVEILEKTERWWRVRNAYDNYEGWLDFRQLTAISASGFLENQHCRYIAPPQINNLLSDTEGSTYLLSPSSNLPGYKDGYCFLGDQPFKVLFEPLDTQKGLTADIVTTAMFFRNVPYLWGGKNLFGMDCSGFVQTVFKLNGLKMKRDAYQQAEEGTVVDFLPEIKPGDVAFFDNAEGRITHVGIMIDPTQIIHSSSKVRIDPMDNEGIYNAELGRYTHKLRIVKRFME